MLLRYWTTKGDDVYVIRNQESLGSSKRLVIYVYQWHDLEKASGGRDPLLPR
jgi:hypothetical protein